MNGPLLKTAINAFMIGTVLMAGQAMACIGPVTPFNVDLSFEGENVIVGMATDKKAPIEALDDTGYLTSQLLITYFAKDSAGNFVKRIQFNKNTGARSLLLSQLKRFKTQIQNLPPDWSRRSAEILPKIAKLESLVAASEAETSEVLAAFSDLNATLHTGGEGSVNVKAAYRTKGTKEWRPEVPISQLDLPGYVRTRSSGCGSSIQLGLPKAGAGSTGSGGASRRE